VAVVGGGVCQRGEAGKGLEKKGVQQLYRGHQEGRAFRRKTRGKWPRVRGKLAKRKRCKKMEKPSGRKRHLSEKGRRKREIQATNKGHGRRIDLREGPRKAVQVKSRGGGSRPESKKNKKRGLRYIFVATTPEAMLCGTKLFNEKRKSASKFSL